jgi:hypothetical protein
MGGRVGEWAGAGTQLKKRKGTHRFVVKVSGD